MNSATDILKKYWGFQTFRALQAEIIEAVNSGKDVLAILPTGGGKSVCFQVPALMQDGLCLVVSPLIALMKDQVENLNAKGIAAAAIHTGINYLDVKILLQQAASGHFKFLYVSPERLQTPLFKEYLPALDINFLAVDEAHCISQWGYDFRPPYLEISAIRNEKPQVPIIALTASATQMVQKDICDKLLFQKDHAVFRQSFERPNLSYSVFEPEAKESRMIEIIGKVNGSGIVYCKTRKLCRHVASLLTLNGVSADYYHAGLTSAEREQKQNAWKQSRTRIMVCTNAFGMGIDKPDVRLVVHYNIPDSPEHYYQEAGRAGRDGKKSYAVLLYEKTDLKELKNKITLQYPTFDKLKNYYISLFNFLQVPAGGGEGNTHSFALEEFASNFNLNILEAAGAVQAFAREGLLVYNEAFLKPSILQVIAGREEMNDFEKTNPSLDYLLKGLLRSYEGIKDSPINIYETALAKFLRTPFHAIKADLNSLAKRRMITYEASSEKPQIYLLANRMYSEAFTINMERINMLRERAEERMNAMIDYANGKTFCRSSFFGSYFGDEQAKPCGVCDNCIDAKKKLNETDIALYISTIENRLQPSGFFINDLMRENNLGEQMNYWQAIEYLIAEQIVTTDVQGYLKKRGPN